MGPWNTGPAIKYFHTRNTDFLFVCITQTPSNTRTFEGQWIFYLPYITTCENLHVFKTFFPRENYHILFIIARGSNEKTPKKSQYHYKWIEEIESVLQFVRVLRF